MSAFFSSPPCFSLSRHLRSGGKTLRSHNAPHLLHHYSHWSPSVLHYVAICVLSKFLICVIFFFSSPWKCIVLILPLGSWYKSHCEGVASELLPTFLVGYDVQLLHSEQPPNLSMQAVSEMHVHLIKYVSTLVTHISKQTEWRTTSIRIHAHAYS